jgi:uncharacterized protein
MKLFLTFLFGIIFGLGLIISQMTDPSKIINFLTFNENWDGSLILVMVSSMLIMMATWRWVFKREQPLIGDSFTIPNLKHIDKRLVTGAAIFGMGWGISGICPGPGLVQLTTFQADFWLFFGCVLIGMFGARQVK